MLNHGGGRRQGCVWEGGGLLDAQRLLDFRDEGNISHLEYGILYTGVNIGKNSLNFLFIICAFY